MWYIQKCVMNTNSDIYEIHANKIYAKKQRIFHMKNHTKMSYSYNKNDLFITKISYS